MTIAVYIGEKKRKEKIKKENLKVGTQIATYISVRGISK